MKNDTPKTIYLKDYRPYPYDLLDVDLNFDIHEGYTLVSATLKFKARLNNQEPLYLYGEALEILDISLDGQALEKGNDFEVNDKGLTLPCPERSEFSLFIKTRIQPEKNTRLEGLYKSGDTYCTQCEAEGFRRITYFPDRPDVMSVFTTRIEASKEHYPVLLGNGNRIDHGDAEHGRHFTVWHDPFPKPCYLFALVAGNLACLQDRFTTKSGREVALYIYVRPGDEAQCDHAMESLKKSMKWDENVYGLEYDLDLFNIVAVSDFNMGAMENKSLNIFNTALVLAQKETATDTDFLNVEAVIAHEYFHNWSGNRVTCRDWFQLSLKEGLTVFRDQEFSADMNSRDYLRIDDVQKLRKLQFPEDGGPLAHPIRPSSYQEINNFYTVTVYEKGAEIIRMLRTILGAENYRKGTDLYFSRHDGQAVTCDDFVDCLQEASGIDLTQFKLWYTQAGTPRLRFSGDYDEAQKTYTVHLSQEIPDTPGQSNKKPMYMPVEIGLLNPKGQEIASDTLYLNEAKQSFTFENINQRPTPSILRNFSAPVYLETDLRDDDLAFLMVHDTDGFNRWEAGQTYMLQTIQGMLDNPETSDSSQFLSVYGDILQSALDKGSDQALISQALTLPHISTIIQGQKQADPVAIYKVRQKLAALIKRTHKNKLEAICKQNRTDGAYKVDSRSMGGRALRNVALGLLTVTHGTGCARRSKDHYYSADNMTDRMAALSALASNENPERAEVFVDFYDRFKDYPLVIDKWFAVQASAVRKDQMEHLRGLRNHADFHLKNPNRVRSLYAAFAMNNPAVFHAQDGSGYKFLRDAIIELNIINPQIAARLLTPMRDWRRYTLDRQDKIKACLEHILMQSNLSSDVYEIANKSLNA